MNRLLRLYPHAWRERYADEMGAVLDDLPFTPRAALDLLVGAADAHLHPLGRGRRIRLPIAYQVALLAVLSTVALDALQQVVATTSLSPPIALVLQYAPLGALGLAALASRRAGWTMAVWFCVLAALQVTLGGALLDELYYRALAALEPLRAPLAAWQHPTFRLAWLLTAAEAAAWGAVVALLLRRAAGVAWPLGLCVGLALIATADFGPFSGGQLLGLLWPEHPVRLIWLLAGGQAAAWAALAAALLRRAGLAWWAGLLAGCALWLLLRPSTSPASWLMTASLSLSVDQHLWRLPVMLWAAVVAAIVTRRGTAAAMADV